MLGRSLKLQHDEQRIIHLERRLVFFSLSILDRTEHDKHGKHDKHDH